MIKNRLVGKVMSLRTRFIPLRVSICGNDCVCFCKVAQLEVAEKLRVDLKFANRLLIYRSPKQLFFFFYLLGQIDAYCK